MKSFGVQNNRITIFWITEFYPWLQMGPFTGTLLYLCAYDWTRPTPNTTEEPTISFSPPWIEWGEKNGENSISLTHHLHLCWPFSFSFWRPPVLYWSSCSCERVFVQSPSSIPPTPPFYFFATQQDKASIVCGFAHWPGLRSRRSVRGVSRRAGLVMLHRASCFACCRLSKYCFILISNPREFITAYCFAEG